MLHDATDIPRLIACATDQARHDRMLDITGGDTAALTEITDAQDLLLRLDEPDLAAMARLNVHRSVIADRNAHVPAILPTVWATIGHPERAEALARSITSPAQQARALAGLVGVAARAGDLDRARMLAERALTLIRAIADASDQAYSLRRLVRAVAAGDLDWAEALARSITSPAEQAGALATWLGLRQVGVTRLARAC